MDPQQYEAYSRGPKEFESYIRGYKPSPQELSALRKQQEDLARSIQRNYQSTNTNYIFPKNNGTQQSLDQSVCSSHPSLQQPQYNLYQQSSEKKDLREFTRRMEQLAEFSGSKALERNLNKQSRQASSRKILGVDQVKHVVRVGLKNMPTQNCVPSSQISNPIPGVRVAAQGMRKINLTKNQKPNSTARTNVHLGEPTRSNSKSKTGFILVTTAKNSPYKQNIRSNASSADSKSFGRTMQDSAQTRLVASIKSFKPSEQASVNRNKKIQPVISQELPPPQIAMSVDVVNSPQSSTHRGIRRIQSFKELAVVDSRGRSLCQHQPNNQPPEVDQNHHSKNNKENIEHKDTQASCCECTASDKPENNLAKRLVEQGLKDHILNINVPNKADMMRNQVDLNNLRIERREIKIVTTRLLSTNKKVVESKNSVVKQGMSTKYQDTSCARANNSKTISRSKISIL